MVISLIPRSLEALEFGYKIPTLYILSEIVNCKLVFINNNYVFQDVARYIWNGSSLKQKHNIADTASLELYEVNTEFSKNH